MRFSWYISALCVSLFLFKSVFASGEKNTLDATEWTFAKVKAKGWFVGKDRFLQYYTLEPGQLFDEAKHKHALTTIESEMKAEGYLDAQVSASKQFDSKNKSILITLTLTPGSKYTIGAVRVHLEGVKPSLRPQLQQELQDVVSKELLKTNLLTESLNAQAEKIRLFLLAHGFVHATLGLTTLKDQQKKTAAVTYHVAVTQKKQYCFVGNEFFGTAHLMKELFEGESQDIALSPEQIAEDIVGLYKKKGFFAVHVVTQNEPQATRFKIYEGPRRIVTKVTVKGAPAEAEQQIKRALSELYALTQYDEDTIAHGIAQLSLELGQLGYWNPQVQRKAPLQDAGEIIIEVVPGERRMIASVGIKGHPELLTKEPFIHWTKKVEPEPLSPKLIESQRTWLLTHFRQAGYLSASVQHELKPVKGKKGVYVLVWLVDTKGGPVLFGKTTIVGLHRMRPAAVTRELCYAEGDIWNKEKIEQTIKRLRGLGMFESVSVDQAPLEPAAGNYQPLLIKCVEEDPFEIRTRFGLQFVSKSFTHISWSTYKIGGSFVWKNPAGICDQLRLDADLTRFTRNIAASYDMPWIGPYPIRTSVSVYSNRFDQPLSTNKQHRLYKEAHDGFSVTFNHQHTWWQSTVISGFEVNQLYGISKKLAKVIQFEPLLVDKHTPYLYIEPSITIEQCDNKADPRKGFLTYMSLKAMVPPSVKGGSFVRALF